MTRFPVLRRCLVATAWSASLVPAAGAAQRYHVTMLSPELGAGIGDGINAAGVVLGAQEVSPALFDHGQVTLLPNLPGVEGQISGQALDVNDAGVAVGYSEPSWNGPTAHAVRWKDGKIKDLGLLLGVQGESTGAVAIDKHGQILCEDDIGFEPQGAFIWQDGAKTAIAPPPGFQTLKPTALNDKGHAVGVAFAQGVEHGFLYRDGQSVDIGAAVGSYVSDWANAINAKDQVVGAWYSPVSQSTTAFLWADGQMTDLGTLYPGGSSTALGINSSGVVVGQSFMTSGLYSSAFIYRHGRMTDLDTLLDAASAGWHLDAAIAINDAGVVSGIGTYNYQKALVIATPVTP